MGAAAACLSRFTVMANTKSAIKNARKAKARYTRNRTVLSKIKTLSKKVSTLKAAGKAAEAKSAAVELSSAVDRATKSGVLHRNAAARKKSQVSALVFAK